jgi:ubiquinone/menaquinone biosynthesis C-methylase UbiE
MTQKVSEHYGGGVDLIAKIERGLRGAGKNPGDLKPKDLAPIDEFHFRGRKATLQLAEQMRLASHSRVLDIGSGLGGPARTLAEEYGCHVTGIDLTQAFCDAAGILSSWVNLAGRTEFLQGDATDMPFGDDRFDAAITLHVAMNIAAKDKLYAQARRVLKPGAILAVFDILQGEGGAALYPAPWAEDPSISHLATPDEMERLLSGAGFTILAVDDSTRESLDWLEARTVGETRPRTPPITVQILFDDKLDWPRMIRNQALGLRERRILTVSYICAA